MTKRSPKPHSSKRSRKFLGFLLEKIAAPFVFAIFLSMLLAIVSPEMRALILKILNPPRRDRCLPTEIVGKGLSLDISSLIRATNRAYWHHIPEQDGQLIPDPNSADAELWRRLYMRQIACRLDKRESLEWPTTEEEINRALRRINKTRQEFDSKKDSLLWSREAESQAFPPS